MDAWLCPHHAAPVALLVLLSWYLALVSSQQVVTQQQGTRCPRHSLALLYRCKWWTLPQTHMLVGHMPRLHMR